MILRLFLDFPVELGQEFRYKTVENFKRIVNAHGRLVDDLEYHRKEEKHAHDAKQIDYTTNYSRSVSDALDKQNNRINNLVVGANGDAMAEVKDSRVALDGTISELLSQRLDYDFGKLNKKIDDNFKYLNDKIERIVNVNDYGADPTGQKDSTLAFQKAFGEGHRHVHMTEGTYIISGVKMPNYTILSGEGKGITYLRIADDAPAETIGITNLNMDGTAEYIGVDNFTIDGNRTRQGNTLSPAGGSRSSNIRFAGVKHGFAYSVESFSSLLHGIDVTYSSDDYFYQGDGIRVKEALESKYIHIQECETYDFGDDGITTHHSRYLILQNNYSHDPVKDSGNHNGIEVDDGSQHVFVMGNKTEKCFGGLEIKAHESTSAASDVVVSDHLDIKSIRSYNIRHIGHHRAGDVQSKTAYNIMLNNCTSLYPQYNGSYENTTPRAMVICAYRNVVVNNFTAIGDGNFMANMPVIAVQFRAENVMLNNINVSGFKNSLADVKVFGGANRPKKVSLSNINIVNSSNNRGIAGGGKIYDLRIINANLQGNGTGNGVELYNNTAEIVGVSAENYKRPAMIAGKEYFYMPTSLKGGFSGGSTGGAAIAERSAVIASTGGSFAHSNRSFVIGSGAGSIANGSRSGVISSLSSVIEPGGHTRMIINSKNMKNSENYHIKAGYGADGPPSESNTKLDISTFTGTIKTAGQVQSGQNFGDYAEYFESQSGMTIPTGNIVTLDGRFIRKAQVNDIPIGVISETAGVILGDQMFHHKDKYLKNEFGGVITESVKKEWQDDAGNWYSDTVEMPVKNPDFDERDEEEYLSRAERPEWNVVGLIGQVYIRIDGTVKENDYIKPVNGVGTKDNINGYYRVEQITTPYDNDKGYGVAIAFIHPITPSIINKGSVK